MENIPKALLRSLRSQSTWWLLALGFVTYGVYFGHYIRGRTLILNRHLPADRAIPQFLVWTVLLVAYVNLFLFVFDSIFELSEPVAVGSQLLDLAWGASVIWWGFSARSRMHFLLSATYGDDFWFNPLATFLFTPVYFNYKVNVLEDLSRVEGMKTCPECGLLYDPSTYRSDARQWVCTRCSSELPKSSAMAGAFSP
jgi:hypothetical protein